jgi:hypothetical protein
VTSKRNIVMDRRSRPIDGHVYTLPVVREIPPEPPDAAGTESLW